MALSQVLGPAVRCHGLDFFVIKLSELFSVQIGKIRLFLVTITYPYITTTNDDQCFSLFPERADSNIAESGSLDVNLALHYVIQHSARNMNAIKKTIQLGCISRNAISSEKNYLYNS